MMGAYLLAAGVAAGSPPGLAADGQPRPADVLREAIEPARAIQAPAGRDETLRDVTAGLALLGDVPDATAVKDAIGNPLIRAGTSMSSPRHRPSRGDVAGALRTAEALDNPHAQQAGYRTLPSRG